MWDPTRERAVGRRRRLVRAGSRLPRRPERPRAGASPRCGPPRARARCVLAEVRAGDERREAHLRAPGRRADGGRSRTRRRHRGAVVNIAFFGSSLVSAWWNGAATYYRGVIRGLHEQGHHVTFYEPIAYDRQQHRDI